MSQRANGDEIHTRPRDLGVDVLEIVVDVADIDEQAVAQPGIALVTDQVLEVRKQSRIAPVVDAFAAAGENVRGPLPADTAFTRASGHKDAVLAMYHDQGLPVLKYAGFGGAVNVTLGLPIVRTSVDHGTGLDIAGQGTADAGSLVAALELAAALANRQ